METDDTSNFPFKKSPITNEIVNDTNYVKWSEANLDSDHPRILSALPPTPATKKKKKRKRKSSSKSKGNHNDDDDFDEDFFQNQLHNVICGLMKRSVSSNLKIKSSKISFASVFINLKK